MTPLKRGDGEGGAEGHTPALHVLPGDEDAAFRGEYTEIYRIKPISGDKARESWRSAWGGGDTQPKHCPSPPAATVDVFGPRVRNIRQYTSIALKAPLAGEEVEGSHDGLKQRVLTSHGIFPIARSICQRTAYTFCTSYIDLGYII